MARRAAFHHSRAAKRSSVWLGFNLASTSLVGSSKQQLLVLNASALALRPFTVVRTHLLLRFESDQAAVSETPRGAVAGIVIDEIASAAGAASMPGPGTVTDADWFFYQVVTVHFQFLSSIGFQGDSGVQYNVNSKAMRKVDVDQDLVIMSEMLGASGAILAIGGRILVKLH